MAEIQRARFAWGSSILRAEDHEALDNAVGLLMEHPELRLEVEPPYNPESSGAA